MCAVASQVANRKCRIARAGFTLIEAAMVTTIIGVGVVAMLELLATGTVTNASGTEMTTGLTLARNIRELSLGLNFADPAAAHRWDLDAPPTYGPETGETLATYDDIDDLISLPDSVPIDAQRNALDQYQGWQQVVSVQSVDPDRLTVVVPHGTSPAIRMTVTVKHNGNQVCDLSWFVFCPSAD